VIKKAQHLIWVETLEHNYLPILGIEEFTKSACSLVFGNVEKEWND